MIIEKDWTAHDTSIIHCSAMKGRERHDERLGGGTGFKVWPKKSWLCAWRG
jgi:hypothetical protein